LAFSGLARFAGARVDLVDETFSSGPRPGAQSHLDVIFVTRRTLRAFLDPPRLRVGTEMHVRIVGGILFGPVLRSTANPGRKIITGYENSNGSSHQAQAQKGRGHKTA